jgi:hypothetical protein
LSGEAQYFIAQALEECFNASRHLTSDVATNLNMAGTSANELRNRMACQGFENESITQDEIMNWLRNSAAQGDPRAIARTLLFRDIADDKFSQFPMVQTLLTSQDPFVIRDLGAYLTRGESSWLMGTPLAATSSRIAAAAWDLAACDFGLNCTAGSRMLPQPCEMPDRCGAQHAAESVEEFAQIQQLRKSIVAAIRLRDWEALGLGRHYLAHNL